MKTFWTKSTPQRRSPARRAHVDRIAAEGDFLGHPRNLTLWNFPL
jgi:hypothetical protein